MLTPSDLGLPSKFGDWRTGQWDAIKSVATSSKPGFLLDLPTGTGKSAISVGVGKLLNERTLILVQTKSLQDQILNDFPFAKSIMGRNNFRCERFPTKFPTISASECTHTKLYPCKHRSKCPYEVQKRIALNAPLCVSNYSYFLVESNYVGSFDDMPFVIGDEWDTVESSLLDFVQVTFTKKQIDALDLDPPQYITKFESWKEWAPGALSKVNARVSKLEHFLSNELANAGGWETVDFSLIREKKRLEQLQTKLELFIREVDQYWVWYPDDKFGKWEFKPIFVNKYGKRAMWDHCKRILGMSATILNPAQLSRDVGFPDYGYMKMDSPFPVENRRIFYKPVAEVTFKKKLEAYPKIAKETENIIKSHPNDKILVHCVSYELMNYLKANTNTGRIITHTTSDRAQKLELLRTSKLPLVLLSPSMERGVDLPDDSCRVVIIPKLPFPNLADPRISKRVHASKDGNSWYACKTAQSLVQSTGRHIRSDTDWGVSYILDSSFERFMSENGAMIPGWWKAAIVK